MNEVTNIFPIKLQEGDLVLVEVREGLSEDRRNFLQQVLEDSAEDVLVHFLVLPENTINDIRRLPLTEMLHLRDLLDTFIEEQLAPVPVGEA